ncbi:RNA-directed DNA polymerase (reverse transcriptase)-related family protein [Melia azedarach]|uniref:RNA-directed DNA polymerase (Reverse transcriptase)-related family protein n=1 Tax=Melia azedarach TaxID=155640 RepID=A0ACC1YI74_MELAZ|nr:RNA-directed DNA polymerase (reverse transcriptase)-related family protein [Melia azedarach]
MEDAMDATASSPSLDLQSIRSEVRELMEICRSNNEDEPAIAPSDSDKLVKQCAHDFESKVKEIISECSDLSFLGIEDLDVYLEHLKEELKTVEAESSKISNEIEALTGTNIEDSQRLESDLEELNCALDLIASQGPEKGKEDAHVDCSVSPEDQSDLTKIHEDHKFEILEIESEIEKNRTILNSLQDLDSIFKRFDAVERIEDSLTGLKVIDLDGKCVRLSLQTYIPKLEGSLFQYKIDDLIEPSEVNHELLIEVIDGTMELKNVEIFPNDVYISDIIDAAKSFRQLASQSALLETSSSLQWFVGKLQDRIILSTLRRFVVRVANKSRHFFEYMDRDEMVVAHLVGGLDAFIKPSQGWPLLNSPLKLISLKSLADNSKGISLSFLCMVEEAANSLDPHIRQNLSSFINAVEKILIEQMRVELHSDDTPGK